MVDSILKDRNGTELVGQATHFFPITPSNTTPDFATPTSLYIGVGGSLVVIGWFDNKKVTFANVPNGAMLPILVKRVCSESTCSAIVGLIVATTNK